MKILNVAVMKEVTESTENLIFECVKFVARFNGHQYIIQLMQTGENSRRIGTCLSLNCLCW